MTGKGHFCIGRRRDRSRRAMRPEEEQRRLRHRRKWRKVLLFLAGVLTLCVGIFLLLDRTFAPQLREMAGIQAKFLAVTTINRAVDEELRQHPVTYEQLSGVSRLQDGRISAVQVDPAAVNDVSARLTLAANAAISEALPRRVGIPLGTVSGIQMLTGRGPTVWFLIQPASYVESSFISTLESAGFNQSMHNLVLRMTVTVETFCVGYHTRQEVVSDMILAQTVIVGDVPDFYAKNS